MAGDDDDDGNGEESPSVSDSCGFWRFLRAKLGRRLFASRLIRCGAAETRTNGLQGTHRRMGDLADTARSAWYNRAKTSSRYPCATPRARPSGPRPAEHHRTRPSSFRNNGTKQGNGTPNSKQCPTMPKVHVRRAFFLTCPQARAHASQLHVSRPSSVQTMPPNSCMFRSISYAGRNQVRINAKRAAVQL